MEVGSLLFLSSQVGWIASVLHYGNRSYQIYYFKAVKMIISI